MSIIHNKNVPKTYQECVPLKISYHLDFLYVSQVWSMFTYWHQEVIITVGKLFNLVGKDLRVLSENYIIYSCKKKH